MERPFFCVVAVTFILLTLAIVALWVPVGPDGPTRAAVRETRWLLPLIAAMIVAWRAGILEPWGIVWVVGFGFAARTFGVAPPGSWPRNVSAIAIIVLAAGLMAHQLPGFNNPRVIDAATFGPGAIGYRLHLNFDKPMIGLFLLAWCHDRLRRRADWRAMFGHTAPSATGLIAVIMIFALASGYVRLEPKLPREGWLWAWANLILTCVAEEAFFRGFVQAQLQRRWQNVRRGAWLALALAAVLFGLAHAAGGAAYVVLASVAGAGYGWAYLRSGGRIEASILTHFALNATHFFFFTFPALARS